MAREQPKSSLARRVLPRPLLRALRHIFAQGVEGCMLVGGTALAGYYAGHRRSDDLDLFVGAEEARRAVVLALASLEQLGAEVTATQRTAQFHASHCSLSGYHFTAQVVLDPRLFEVGSGVRADDGVWVADLDTLLKQKAATLVSRCSEKDLYDLRWIFEKRPTLDVRALLALGAEIDGGMTAESALLSLTGAQLSESACGFSVTEDAAAVFAVVSALRDRLALAFHPLATGSPIPPVGELIRALDESGG